MTRNRAKELAPVIAAYGEGVAIEARTTCGQWMEIGGAIEPVWSPYQDYRIKPAPVTRPMTRGEVLYEVTAPTHMVLKRKTWKDSDMTPSHRIDEFLNEDDDIKTLLYAIIDKHGKPIDGWHKFEVTDEKAD